VARCLADHVKSRTYWNKVRRFFGRKELPLMTEADVRDYLEKNYEFGDAWCHTLFIGGRAYDTARDLQRACGYGGMVLVDVEDLAYLDGWDD
jgi:hypothetical protein